MGEVDQTSSPDAPVAGAPTGRRRWRRVASIVIQLILIAVLLVLIGVMWLPAYIAR